MAECIVCTNNASIATLPPRETVLVEGNWRVAHAFGTSLPGWLVIVPTRHVTALHEMDADDAARLGTILHRASDALRTVVGCEKAYFMLFAEAEGFEHLHVHVVPRMPWFSAEQRGPRVFSMLGVPPADEVPEAERDRLALLIRDAMGQELRPQRSEDQETEMEDDDERDARRMNIGGKYGSPTVTVALPFAHITNTDTELRDIVSDLATLVAKLAGAAGDETELDDVREAATELVKRCAAG